MPRPPETDEGWYVLHDLRSIDWDAWRAASGRERDRAIEAGREYLEDAVAVADADDGASATYAVLGHEADLMILHLRPTLDDLDFLERQFAQTALDRFTERTGSYLSITEASGYTGAEDYFDPDAEADPGMRNYIESRLYPDLPDAEFVSFYPMDKRRDPEQNWYDLSFEERADYMEAHGEIGRKYGGKVSQIISGSIGLDDFEWGITLFADDPTDVKELLYEMRFDPSSSRFADFGPFYSGRQFPPADLEAFLAGERVPTEGPSAAGGEDGAADSRLDDALAALEVEPPAHGHAVLVESDADPETVQEEVDGLRGNFEHYDTHRGTEVHPLDSDASGAGVDGEAGEDGTDAIAAVVSVWETGSAADTASGFLAEIEGATGTQVGTVGDVESDADEAADSDADDVDTAHDGGSAATTDHDLRAELEAEGIYGGSPHGEDVYALVLYSEADVEELAEEVSDLADGFDRYDTHAGTDVFEAEGAEPAVVSLWDTADAAETASDYLADLPGIVREAGESEGFGTMGMFYTVKPEYREEFQEQFAAVGDLLEDMAGHRETTLYANREDGNEMFIASQWDSKEDAMAFFRSDEFSETVEWGRDVLADRPRHVFLA
jgi:chlorite dismutase/heme-degrading monooxygenase HmoA